MQHYFVQRAQINALEGEVAEAKADLERAQAELQKWRDPEYIKSQARDRLRFVMPGEKQYIVSAFLRRSIPSERALRQSPKTFH